MAVFIVIGFVLLFIIPPLGWLFLVIAFFMLLYRAARGTSKSVEEQAQEAFAVERRVAELREQAAPYKPVSSAEWCRQEQARIRGEQSKLDELAKSGYRFGGDGK